jgi:hypothetical protein
MLIHMIRTNSGLAEIDLRVEMPTRMLIHMVRSRYMQSTFGWGAAVLGYATTLQYAANAFGLMLVLPWVQRRLGTKQVLLLSCTSGTVYAAAFGVVGCVPFVRCSLEQAQSQQVRYACVNDLPCPPFPSVCERR